jgi:hypothetical protein
MSSRYSSQQPQSNVSQTANGDSVEHITFVLSQCSAQMWELLHGREALYFLKCRLSHVSDLLARIFLPRGLCGLLGVACCSARLSGALQNNCSSVFYFSVQFGCVRKQHFHRWNDQLAVAATKGSMAEQAKILGNVCLADTSGTSSHDRVLACINAHIATFTVLRSLVVAWCCSEARKAKVRTLGFPIV